jgi:16S rRNA processing protein RimM
MSVDLDRWVRIGVIGRPHGVRGALKVHLDNPRGRTLAPGRAARCVLGGRIVDVVVSSAGGGVIAFAGMHERDGAVGLVHAELQVRRRDLVGDGEGAFLVDLVGSPVVDVGGAALGTLTAFAETGAQLLAEVTTTDGRVVLVPFVAPIVVEAGPPVILAPPRGLFVDDDAVLDERAADDADASAPRR